MIEIEKEFKIENVLSLRKKMTQADIQQEMMNIGKFLEQNDLKKNGPLVTVTFAIEQSNEQPLLDTEILVPLDQPTKLYGEYNFKNVFHLMNAVYARHEGNPNTLQDTYNELNQYINQKGLQPITAAYNVNVVDLQPGQSMDNMIVDVYIGVNPSIL
ncbi:AraC family transcriptional regulator [Paenibacillus amylolyticus]|uniref:AraC family transcriptional regulator n=1 Tax=Paenibacillus amylolyticus TaxID=1451 RepID=A0A1R1BVV2_PAEAM|nr:AraC family transcriptional regulator [Paenibacillus amylolyticus]